MNQNYYGLNTSYIFLSRKSKHLISILLQNILKDISVVGNDIDTRSSIQTGSMLVNKMMVAGQ